MSWLKEWWRALVAVTALAILVFSVGYADVLLLIRNVGFWWLAIYVLGSLVPTMVYGIQVWAVLKIMGYPLRITPVIVATVNAWSLGQLTPMRAGDLSLAGFIGRAVPGALVVGLVGVDKFLSVAALAGILLAVGTSLGLQSVVPIPVIVIAVLGGLAVLAVAIVLLSSTPNPTSVAPGTAGWFVAEAQSALRQFAVHPAAVFLSGLMVVLRWAVIFALVWVLFRALGFAPHLAYVVAASTVGRLIALIPVSVGGIGLKEPLQMVIYSLDGIPAEAVVAVSMIGAIIGIAAAGIAPLAMRALSISGIRRA